MAEININPDPIADDSLITAERQRRRDIAAVARQRDEDGLPHLVHGFPLVAYREPRAWPIAGKRYEIDALVRIDYGFHPGCWITQQDAARWTCWLYPVDLSPEAIAKWLSASVTLKNSSCDLCQNRKESDAHQLRWGKDISIGYAIIERHLLNDRINAMLEKQPR